MPNPNEPKNPNNPARRDEDTMPDRQRQGEREPERQPQRLPGTGREQEQGDRGQRDMNERRPHRDQE